jgi:hypothetical protein
VYLSRPLAGGLSLWIDGARILAKCAGILTLQASALSLSWQNLVEHCKRVLFADAEYARLSATMMWRHLLFTSEQKKHRSRGRSVGARHALVSAGQKRSSAAWVWYWWSVRKQLIIAIFDPEEPGVPKPILNGRGHGARGAWERSLVPSNLSSL